MSTLHLTPDELLTTTRAVRKRLDLARPVEREVLEACLAIAQQAPTGSNRQGWHFIVVTDPARRVGLADCYRRGWQRYYYAGGGAAAIKTGDPRRDTVQRRVSDSSAYLAQHMADVPVLVVPCIAGRTDGLPAAAQAGTWGSILPAVWSFMLAARARGLGTVWTTAQGPLERELADTLGVPYEEVMLAAFIPLAFTIGTDFKPAHRVPREQVLHWERW